MFIIIPHYSDDENFQTNEIVATLSQQLIKRFYELIKSDNATSFCPQWWLVLRVRFITFVAHGVR
jgi:hypothetical protein